MPRGNPSPKLAITVDPDVHAQVVAAAAAEGVSVSAWMTAAARRALTLRDGLAAVAEWEAEHGALTREELDAARRRVGPQAAGRASILPDHRPVAPQRRPGLHGAFHDPGPKPTYLIWRVWVRDHEIRLVTMTEPAPEPKYVTRRLRAAPGLRG